MSKEEKAKMGDRVRFKTRSVVMAKPIVVEGKIMDTIQGFIKKNPQLRAEFGDAHGWVIQDDTGELFYVDDGEIISVLEMKQG